MMYHKGCIRVLDCYHGSRCINNERLEFLGDAIVEYLVR